MNTLYLASTSPRRSELLSQVGIKHTIVKSNYKEDNTLLTSPVELVERQALGKARAAIGIPSGRQLVLGADTIVVSDEQVLGKPISIEDARKMLTQLSGKEHLVITGVALLCDGVERVFHVITRVLFKELSDDEINAYIKTGEPFDKAGSYGIQGIGALWVREIHGSYTNIVGLPVEVVYDELQKLLR